MGPLALDRPAALPAGLIQPTQPAQGLGQVVPDAAFVRGIAGLGKEIRGLVGEGRGLFRALEDVDIKVPQLI